MKKNYKLTILTLFALFLLFSTGSVFGQNAYAFNVNGPVMFRVLDQADLDVTGDFTIEAWVQFNNFNGRLVDRQGVFKIYAIANSIRFDRDDGISISTGDISGDAGDNSWHHIAVSRDDAGGITRLFYDGVEKESADLALVASTNLISIGGQDSWYGNWDARIDEFRFSNSTRYTANFTPSTTDLPYTDDANTILLFHFDNNTQVPPENDGSIGYTYQNGRGDGTVNPMSISDYVAPTGLPLPVELTKFEAVAKGDNVVLTWETATEVNNYGFEVEASTSLTTAWKVIGFVDGAGNSNSPKQYSFVDAYVVGEVSYRLQQIDTDGGSEYSDVVTVNANGLAKTELFQNYPNPFNPATQIGFKLADATQVNVSVYNTLGQQVAELVNGEMNAGVHRVDFNASNLTSGFYVYRIETPDYTKTMKMLLLK